ncbi:MAG: radical SAM protein [bacterium]|nr:radical SAM protein [bacterium]
MLQVSEIYRSLCGESLFSGRPCTLVRLTACHVRCVWCDSAHAFNGGHPMPVPDVLGRVRELGPRTVLVTGGEPLLQPAVKELLQALLDDGREVLLETSGTLGPRSAVRLDEVPPGVHRIVDLKAPGSGLAPGVIDWAGIAALGPGDELKAVLADRRDYEWARDLVREPGRLPAGVPVSFSPVQDGLAPADLAGWILEDGLEVRFQLQLHKVVWPGVERGV